MAVPAEILAAINAVWDELSASLKTAAVAKEAEPVDAKEPVDEKEIEPVKPPTDAEVMDKPSPTPLAMTSTRVRYLDSTWKVRACREDGSGSTKYRIEISKR